MPYCVQCGAPLGAQQFCARCGTRAGTGGSLPEVGDSGFTENQLGALAYFTPVPAIALLIVEPYSRHEFLRFHSYQCLLLAAAALIMAMFFSVFAFLLPFDILFGAVTQLAILTMWVMAALGAWRGEKTLLPIIGPIAARKARKG